MPVNKPEISVIVPVYKSERWLDECVKSILCQNFTEIELILIDDGSPDKCPAMCDAYAIKDDRVKVIHQENAGQAHARNKGIAFSKGRKLTFVDSDDILVADSLGKLNYEMERNGAEVVLAMVERFTSKGVKRPYTQLVERKIMTGKEALSLILDGKLLNVSVCGGIYKRQVFEGIKMPEGYICEDWYITPDIYMRVSKVIFLPIPWYLYRENNNSTMAILQKKGNPQIVSVAEHCIELIGATDESLYFNTLWANLKRVWKWVGICYTNRRQKDERDFLALVRRQMKYYLPDLKKASKMSLSEKIGVYSFCYCEPLCSFMYYIKSFNYKK